MITQIASDSVVEAIDKVWSGHRVNFDIVENAQRICVGYYDPQRQVTIATRTRQSPLWQIRKLDHCMGWDSHSHIALGFDLSGRLHVAADMHATPLNYWRENEAGDLRSIQRLQTLHDPAAEKSMTYPRFTRDKDERLIFSWRDGRSGQGVERSLIEDPDTGQLLPLHSGAFLDGAGKMSAYAVGPSRGRDGNFHLVWVWRDSPDAATTHDICYARSADLCTWQDTLGVPLPTPIKPDHAAYVDLVAAGQGLINNNTLMVLDDRLQPVIAYHKFDPAGNTQVYLARPTDANGWQINCLTDWAKFRWDFGGGGALDFRLKFLDFRADVEGRLILSLRKDGQYLELVIGQKDLRLLQERPFHLVSERESGHDPYFSQMQHNLLVEAWSGAGSALQTPARLSWATLPPNRDRARDYIPTATTLYLWL